VECKNLDSRGQIGKFEKGNAEEEVSVLGVSEVRGKRQGEIRGNYTVYYSVGEWAEKGVAIVVHKSIVRSVVKKTVYNDRIIAIKLRAELISILMMQVYMPTSEHEDDGSGRAV
jgi:exonuclease III